MATFEHNQWQAMDACSTTQSSSKVAQLVWSTNICVCGTINCCHSRWLFEPIAIVKYPYETKVKFPMQNNKMRYTLEENRVYRNNTSHLIYIDISFKVPIANQVLVKTFLFCFCSILKILL